MPLYGRGTKSHMYICLITVTYTIVSDADVEERMNRFEEEMK